MKRVCAIALVVLIACSSSKKVRNGESSSVMKNDTLPLIPYCVQQLINRFAAEEKQNPPRKIIRYEYEHKTVYYVTPPCCDFFSDLYDSTCVLIGHPDGGFTGKGDGKLSDFNEKKKREVLVWEDRRK